MEKYDLHRVGSGPAPAAAIKRAKFGKRAALVKAGSHRRTAINTRTIPKQTIAKRPASLRVPISKHLWSNYRGGDITMADLSFRSQRHQNGNRCDSPQLSPTHHSSRNRSFLIPYMQ